VLNPNPGGARVGRAAEKLEDATFEMQLVATVVEATSQPLPRRDPLRSLMDVVYREVRRAQRAAAPARERGGAGSVRCPCRRMPQERRQPLQHLGLPADMSAAGECLHAVRRQAA
jgi:hypothetical protein